MRSVSPRRRRTGDAMSLAIGIAAVLILAGLVVVCVRL
jgi:hypothetical protein